MKMKKSNHSFVYLSALFIALLVVSCSGKEIVFESKKDFKETFWRIDSTAIFDFNVTENENYDLNLNVRSDEAYRSCNLFVITQLMSNQDTIFSEKQEFFLSDCNTGEPFGKNVGNFYDHVFSIKKQYQLEANKKYTLVVKQFMRADSLQNIHSVSFVVSKVKN